MRQIIKPGAIILASVQHTGTRFVCKTIGGGRAKLRPDLNDNIVYFKGEFATPDMAYDYIHGHFDNRTEKLKELSLTHKTIIPLRHPIDVAVSWKIRGPDALRRTPTFLDQWVRMDEFPQAFFFKIEKKPFRALSEYLGRPVNKIGRRVGHHDYKYPKDKAAFLGDDMKLVKEALNTEIGRRFYKHESCIP